jgi:hypothetical protein
MPIPYDAKLQPNQIQILITADLDPEDNQSLNGVGLSIRPEFEDGDPTEVALEIITLLLSNVAPHLVAPAFRVEQTGTVETL